MQESKKNLIPVVAAVAAAFALAACSGPDDERTAGQRVDSAVATMEQKAEEMRQDTARAVERGKEEVAEAGAAVKEAAKDASAATSEKVADATITTKVNAELAKDSKLSALKIDVDTTDGRVELQGTAPDAESKERAAQIASAVQGVTSVDNQLRVGNM